MLKYIHMRRLEPISNLIIKKSRSKLARPIAASVILDKFKKVCEQNLSPTVFNGTKFISYKDKIIKIECVNSAIAQEVKLNQQKLLDILNKKEGRQIAEKLSIIFI